MYDGLSQGLTPAKAMTGPLGSIAEQMARNRAKKFTNEVYQARQDGKISDMTYNQIMDSMYNPGSPGYSQGSAGGVGEFNSLVAMFQGEVEGKTKEGRSRLSTQKMFDLMNDQPGKRQTLLTPRSNSSKAILGV